MIVVCEERYYNAAEAADYIGVTRNVFYQNVRPLLQPYKQGGGRRWLYKQSELEPFRSIQPVSKEAANVSKTLTAR